MNNKRFDRFGAEIICRFCRSKSFAFDHHPNKCDRCYLCGKHGHKTEDCPINSNKLTRYYTRVPKVINKGNAVRKFISFDNSDLLKEDECVAIDVEKIEGKTNQLPGWVVVYKYPKISRGSNMEKIVYSTKIRQTTNKVNNFKTPWSGLTRIDLSEEAVPYEIVKEKLKQILKNRLVIGVNLNEDLKTLDLDHFIKAQNRFEFYDHFLDDNNQPINLKVLAFAFLGKRIQEFDPEFNSLTGHDSVIDCQCTMRIYNSRKHPGNQPINGSYQWCRNLVEEAKGSGKILQL